MSKYTTYQTQLVEAIIASNELPEFIGDAVNGSGKITMYGNVFSANGVNKYYGKSLRDHVQYAVSRNNGLMLIFYGREARNTNVKSKTLMAEVTMKCELVIDPIRYLKRPGVRKLEEMEEAVAAFMHGLVLGGDRHCNQSIRVPKWSEVGDAEFYVTSFEVVRPVVQVGT